ncbi:hypothetical protein Sango_1685900 [Sesamum angolense]|uniref:CCHC-type domain-containing protein n=1 Tax=Sesamum angolense TaxID=2727404 RepID=A0AAE2BRP8_9LAMI|nr:hypothetical protein Sango_1685900 [Sesamum angolense]
MESDLSRLGASLSLTEEEESGLILPAGLWHADPLPQGFFIVGRVLSQRGFHPEALHTTLKAAFNPVRGMEFKVIEGDRFLLKFFHVLDHNRVLDRSPWALGKLKEVDLDSNGEVWGASVRVRVAIDITKPLKRALKLRTVLGDEILVTFTYERLPNFCYLCGRLGHLSRTCELQLQDGFCDPGPNTPFGPWLRAPAPPGSRGRSSGYAARESGSNTRRPSYRSPGSLQSENVDPNCRRGPAIFGNFSSSPPNSSPSHSPPRPRPHVASTSAPTSQPLDSTVPPLSLLDPL